MRPPLAALGLSVAPEAAQHPSPSCCCGSTCPGPILRMGLLLGDAPGLPGPQVTRPLLFLSASIVILPSPSGIMPPPIPWRPHESVQTTQEPAQAARGPNMHAHTHTPPKHTWKLSVSCCNERTVLSWKQGTLSPELSSESPAMGTVKLTHRTRKGGFISG